MPFCTVLEAKLKYFQFKFIHRILGTNRLLCLMGKVDTDLCTFCRIETESLEHLFWSCHVTSSFLLDCEFKFFGRQFIFSRRDLFFGRLYARYDPLNFFILHCKYYIYNCKLNNSVPDCNSFFHKMKFIIKVEKHIALKSNA